MFVVLIVDLYSIFLQNLYAKIYQEFILSNFIQTMF